MLTFRRPCAIGSGLPPKVVWITAGNTSNRRLKEILSSTLADALDALDAGESLVEIGAPGA
jgi:predicted nuclease of predicted toxin-antitoxin system